jgi:hypothetical protein
VSRWCEARNLPDGGFVLVGSDRQLGSGVGDVDAVEVFPIDCGTRMVVRGLWSDTGLQVAVITLTADTVVGISEVTR